MVRTFESINQAILKFLAPMDEEQTYITIVEESLRLINAELGSIFLIKNDQLERVYASSTYLYKTKPRKRGFLYQAFESGELKILDSSQIRKIEQLHPELKPVRSKSIVVIPLSYRNKSIGIITVISSKEIYFTEEEIHLLKLLGATASLKIRNVQLYTETRKALLSQEVFSAMAAHELRTPVTTISGYVHLMKDKLAKGGNAEARWVDELSLETSRLTKLVSDLVEVNKLNTGSLTYHYKECYLVEIIKRALSDFEVIYPHRQINFINKIPEKNCRVVGDFDRLLQVFLNILDNAAKFSSSEDEMIIKLEQRRGDLMVSIVDQGKGISKKDLKKVFEAFYKGDYNQNKGMGLGLFLAKDVMEHHRGAIHIHSRKGQGTTVEINLPRVKA